MMNTRQLWWKADLFRGVLRFYKEKQAIGSMPILALFSKYSLVRFQDETFHVHTEGISGKEYRVYNKTNEDLLAQVSIRFWSSSAQLTAYHNTYQFSSKFYGILGAKWRTDHREVMHFHHQFLKGNIDCFDNDEASNILLFICGLQLISYYAFLFLFVLIALFIVIL